MVTCAIATPIKWTLLVGVANKMEALWRFSVRIFHQYPNKSFSTITSTNVTWLKKWGRRDAKRRRQFALGEEERLRLHLLKKTAMIPSLVRMKASQDLVSLPRNGSITRVRNRCVLTDRPRGVLTQYRMCRHRFKKLADAGLLAGVRRSSW